MTIEQDKELLCNATRRLYHANVHQTFILGYVELAIDRARQEKQQDE